MFWDVSECVDALGKRQDVLNGRATGGAAEGRLPLQPCPLQWLLQEGSVSDGFFLQLINPLFHKSLRSLTVLLRPVASNACGEQQYYHLSKSQCISPPLVWIFLLV